MAERKYHYKNFRYLVEIDGIAQGGFSEVTIPDSTQTVIEYREGIINPSKQRIIKSSDNLELIAGREYDKPRSWRKITEANDINDPRNVEMGESPIMPPRKNNARYKYK